MRNSPFFYAFCLESLEADYAPRCAACGAATPKGSEAPDRLKLKSCSRCRAILYCSKDCQVSDWTRHRSRCGLYRNALDVALAGLVQPLDISMSKCCDVCPMVEIQECAAIGSSHIWLSGASLPWREKKREDLRFDLNLGAVLIKSENGEAIHHLKRTTTMQAGDAALVMARALGLEAKFASVPGCRLAARSWLAFPGLSRTFETDCSKPRKACDGLCSPTCSGIHRAINAAPLADDKTRAIAATLPIKTPKKARKSKNKSIGSYTFEAKGPQVRESERLFALPGDQIVSLFDAKAVSGNSLGLSPGSQVILADCNTSTGFCRVLCEAGWILFRIDESADEFHELAKATVIGLIRMQQEPFAQVAWPKNDRKMWERMMVYLEDGGRRGMESRERKEKVRGKEVEEIIGKLYDMDMC